jgi:fucose permease
MLKASLPIEETLNISNEELGLLGSLVYAGIVTLGVLAGPIFMRYNAKLIILLSIVAMMGSLFLFTIQYGRTYPFFILRYLTGIS